MIPPEKISDEKLYELCKTFGARALLWRQKFIGLLPEVNRRKLYEKKNFASIYEFAAKLAGVSEEQVRRVLNLEKKFVDAPILKTMLKNGEVSMNKLARVASIATSETQEFWANQVKLLPKSALETLIRDERAALQDGLLEPEIDYKTVPGHTHPASSGRFQPAADVQAELDELAAKGIDVNELLRKMLARRRTEIADAKEEIVKTIQPATSRYIPAKIRKILQEEHGTKCSINGCAKPSEETHHAQRFGLSKNHDPRFLAPLCREHHVIAHSIDVKFHEARTGGGP